MRAPRNMSGPRKASDSSNTGSKSKSAPAKPTRKPTNQMPTRPSAPKQYTRRVDSRGKVSSTPTRKTTSAPSAANKRNSDNRARAKEAAEKAFLKFNKKTNDASQRAVAVQKAMGKRQEGIKPSNATQIATPMAQIKRPTTSSRSSPAQRPTAAPARRSPPVSRLAGLKNALAARRGRKR